MDAPRFPRRHFLRGVGGLALPLPVLPSLLPAREARAASQPQPRLVVLQNRDGTFPSQFWPSADPRVQVDTQIWNTPLADIAGPLSPVLGTAFDGVRPKVNLVRGLDLLTYAFHQAATFLCNSDTNKEKLGEAGQPNVGSAVDCIAEHSAAFTAQPTPLSALRIAEGSRKGSYWRPAGGSDPGVTLMPYLKGPQTVFDAIAGSVKPPSSTQPGSGAATAAAREDKLITDQLLGDYQRFLASARLGGEDRRRVQQHYDLMHDLQKSLATPGSLPVSAQACSVSPNAQPATTARTIDRYNSYIDSIVMALGCGVTRVASLVLEAYDDDGKIHGDVHHSNSHAEYNNGRTPYENTIAWDGWLAQRVGTLVKKLDSIKDVDGNSVLDNSIVVWGNEDGFGKAHTSEGIPIVMAGSAGGRLRTGYYLDYREKPLKVQGDSPGVGWPMPGFWIAVMEALGVTPAEYLKQGDPGGFGEARFQFPGMHRDVANRRSRPLPFLSKNA